MFVRENLDQFRNASADVQMFYTSSSWLKPPGVSQVYMLLIGGGANGTATQGGGSGAVTRWWGAAQHVPDSLFVSVSTGSGSNSTVNYRGTGGLVALLTASGASTTTGAAAMSSNFFAASGFFQSVAGQDQSGGVNASATTFLSGGNGDPNKNVDANYGYSAPDPGDSNGYFLLQPIIVGVGGTSGQKGGIGCGGGELSSLGGPGLVVIASW